MKNPMNLALGLTVVLVAGIASFMMLSQPMQTQTVQSSETITSEQTAEAPTTEQPVETAAIQKASDISWQAYNSGIQTAKDKDKLVMVQFFATWCGYCKKMDNEVFTDKTVTDNLKKHFVSVRVTESSENKVKFEGKDVTEKQLTSLYQVSGFPTILFLDGEGKPLADNQGQAMRIPGFIPAEEMSGILAYIGTKSYKTMDYATYKKNAQKS